MSYAHNMRYSYGMINTPVIVYDLVRFPNCQECQLGFQCPEKLEIGKQWPVVEKNYIATVIKLGKLTSSASQEKMSAKKNSPRFMVSRLEDQTYPPGNPHFGWRPFSLGGFVLLMKLYLRELIFRFLINPTPKGID